MRSVPGATTRRRRFGPLAVLIFAFVGLFAAQTWADSISGAIATAPGQRLGISRDSVRVLIISDSTWLSLRNFGAYDAVQGFPNEMALAHCRRRVEPSCSTSELPAPATLLDELNARGDREGWNTLVVQTGYNDSADNFGRDFRQIVGRARRLGYKRIIWLTLRPPAVNPELAQAYNRSNRILKRLVGTDKFPEVIIADWAAYSADHDTWFREDQIHYTELGSWAAADYISRKVASLYEWPCPQPMQPSAKPAKKCPDPDALEDKPALSLLYPVTVPHEDPTYNWTGSSSWPDPTWWES